MTMCASIFSRLPAWDRLARIFASLIMASVYFKFMMSLLGQGRTPMFFVPMCSAMALIYFAVLECTGDLRLSLRLHLLLQAGLALMTYSFGYLPHVALSPAHYNDLYRMALTVVWILLFSLVCVSVYEKCVVKKEGEA